MATTTTNLGLTKPIGTEKALVSVINGNMDIIDNKVGAVPQNESVQSQITALNNQIANKADYVRYVHENTVTDKTHTFPKATSFIMFVARYGTSATGTIALYIGTAGTGGSNILNVFPASASQFSVSINNLTLTYSTTISTMSVTIISFPTASI